MNFTAKFADILLPVATHFEAEDGAAIWVRGRYIIHRDKIIEPMFESKRDLEILTDLSERLGFKEKFNPKSRQEWIRAWIDGLSRQFEAPIDHDEFIEKGLYKFRYSTPIYAFRDEIEDPDENPQWMARQHHDYQREGNPVGYYVPDMDPLIDKGNTLILSHKNLHNQDITDKLLLDDTIIEVNWEGDIVWEWVCSEHFDEFKFEKFL